MSAGEQLIHVRIADAAQGSWRAADAFSQGHQALPIFGKREDVRDQGPISLWIPLDDCRFHVDLRFVERQGLLSNTDVRLVQSHGNENRAGAISGRYFWRLPGGR